MSKSPNLVLLIACLVVSSSCGRMNLNSLQSDPYLPPPPRSLTPLSALLKPDTMAAIIAESLLVAKAGVPTQEETEAARKAQDKGLFPDRFKTSKIEVSDQESGSGNTSQEQRMIAAREAFRKASSGWLPWNDLEYTMLLNQGWGQLRSVLRSGDEVTTRTSVWPTAVMVVPGTARIIRLEGGWINISRISPRELRCVGSKGDDSGRTGLASNTPVVSGGTPAVRLVAFIEAAESRNRSAVTATTEFRGVTECVGSAVWKDRVADFAFDAWMGADRAAKIGGPPLLSR